MPGTYDYSLREYNQGSYNGAYWYGSGTFSASASVTSHGYVTKFGQSAQSSSSSVLAQARIDAVATSSMQSSATVTATAQIQAFAQSAVSAVAGIVATGYLNISSSASMISSSQTASTGWVLEVPSGVTATPIDGTSVLVSWTTAAGANWYEIERDGRIVGSTQSTEYTDEGLTPDIQVAYRVRSLV